MRSAPFLAALIAVGPACGRDPERAAPAALEPPPPLAPVAGLVGLESRSRLVYHAAPGVQHLLEATYVFPARARWSRSVLDGGPAERVLHHRYGEHVFTVRGREASRELWGTERESLLRSMELRRALFLWPDGFEWHGRGDLRRAGLGSLGTLQARLDADGRPIELASLDRDGVLLECFTALSWQEQGGRTFPAAAELVYRGEPIWVETVERVVTDIGFVDDHFLPLDRRPPGARAHVPLETRLALEPATLRSIELVDHGSFDELVEVARRLHAAERERLAALGFEPAAGLVLELDGAGRPTHLQVRLLPFEGAPPPGYEARASEHARTRVLGHSSQIAPALAELHPPADGRRPWVRIHGGGSLQLVVPDLGR
jgi:hypothetical protein